jgi:sarcosine oxidase subunit gamma
MAGSSNTAELRDVPWRTLVELRIATAEDGTGADTAAVARELGFDLPAAGQTSGDGTLLALWLSPGWWLLDAPATGDVVLEAPLVQRLRPAGRGLSAVEVSAGFAVLELSGPAAPAVLGHGCSIDLHPRVFGPGSAARTMLAKAQVVLAQIDDAPTYRVWVRSSFARYLVAWLLDATSEYTSA